jgi:predicted transcriptional regulator
MISPYEIVSKSALPALRAMVARRLQLDYNMTQQQVANALGITQASVSNYTRRTRGMMVNFESDPTVAKAADTIARGLSKNDLDQEESLKSMTDVLDYIRLNHLMCSLHSDLEPGFQVDGCYACDGALTVKGFDRLKVMAGT